MSVASGRLLVVRSFGRLSRFLVYAAVNWSYYVAVFMGCASSYNDLGCSRCVY